MYRSGRWVAKTLTQLGLVVHLCERPQRCPPAVWNIPIRHVFMINNSGVHDVAFRLCRDEDSGSAYHSSMLSDELMRRGWMLVTTMQGNLAVSMNCLRLLTCLKHDVELDITKVMATIIQQMSGNTIFQSTDQVSYNRISSAVHIEKV